MGKLACVPQNATKRGASPDPLVVLARLQGLALIQGKKQVVAISLLARAGLDRREIAQICGTTPDVVSVRLAEAKRKKR